MPEARSRTRRWHHPRRRVVFALVAAGATTAALVAAPSTSAAPPAAAAPSGRVIVTLKDQLAALPATKTHVVQRRSTARAQQDAVTRATGIPASSVEHLTLANAFVATVTPAQAAALAANPAVAQVVADQKVALTPAPAAAPTTKPARPAAPAKGKGAAADPSTNPYAVCPSDPAKPLLEPEGLSLIRAANQTGAPAAQDIADGRGVTVAVLAEGIDPDAADFRRPDGSSAIVDYQDFSGDPADAPTNTYGPEIFGDASTIAAQGLVTHDLSTFVNPAHPLPAGCNIQIRGVAPAANIVALKVLPTGNYNYTVISNVVQAIDYAVTVDHVNVINESLGLYGFPDSGSPSAIQLFNDQAVAAGVTVVASTGDAGATNLIGDPAADPNIISAAASTSGRILTQVGTVGTTLSNGRWINGNIAAFSSGGITHEGHVPTLTAPGDEGWAACTFATDRPGCTDFSGNPAALEVFGGTSEAAPFIAGTAALVIEAYRNSHGGASPTPARIKQLLTSTATDLGAPGGQQGAGQLDALAAVRLAAQIDKPAKPAKGAAGLLVSAGQLTDTGAPGTRVTNVVTVTNPGTKAVALAPSVRALSPVGVPATFATTMTPATDPSVPGTTGAKVSYQKVPFTVARNIDHLSISYAYPSNPALVAAVSSGTAPQVTVTLLAPDGSFVITSHPQGASSSGNYGNVAVDHPAAGQWTAVVSTTESARVTLGVSFPIPAYQGPVSLAVQAERWISAGQAAARPATVAPGKSATVTIRSTLPASGGDSQATLDLGTKTGSSTVPIVQRVLVPIGARGGRFSGGITGGNGRGGAPSQTFTYAFDVPAGHRDLDVTARIGATGAIPLVSILLVSPNGQVESGNINTDATAAPAGLGVNVDAYAANPAAGRWRLIIVAGGAVSGTQLVTPFSGTIALDQITVIRSALPGSAATTLPAGKATTVEVGLQLPGRQAGFLFGDPRTDTVQDVVLGSQKFPLPLTAADLQAFSGFDVPLETTQVTSTAAADQRVQVQVTLPTGAALLAGPSAVGPVGQPVNGTATSSATVGVSTGALSSGAWTVLPAPVGPYGPQGSPTGTATVSATARTFGFDRAAVASTGDPYAAKLSEQTGLPDVHGLVVLAGTSTPLALTITPTAPVGTVVRGHLDIIGWNTVATTTNYKLQLGAPAPPNQLIASIPYEYTVGPAPTA